MQTTSRTASQTTPSDSGAVKSVFSVVATPIGNLEDITLRALRVLKEADLILCEDTRVTRNLLQKYAIGTATMSYHARSGETKVEHILDMIIGKNIALVSDAGTPGISDPGALLVSKIRERFGAEIASGELTIQAIPGPSAVIAALSIAGVPCADFTFLGFLPHKKGRETLFKQMAEQIFIAPHSGAPTTIVFYESPHRIIKALDSLVQYIPGDKAIVVIGREMTKVYEEIIRGAPEDLKKYFESHPDKIRGEFVVIVSGR